MLVQLFPRMEDLQPHDGDGADYGRFAPEGIAKESSTFDDGLAMPRNDGRARGLIGI